MKSVYYLLLLILVFYSCDQKNETESIAVSSDEVEIHYVKKGSGKPAIIFVHGWSNTLNIWDQQIDHFSEKYTAVGVDLAGFGKSGNNRNSWTTHAFADDVVAVIDKHNLQQVILVGFSMGGPVIVEAARKLPERVKGLVFVDTIEDPYQRYPPEAMAFIDSVFMDVVTNPAPEKLEGVFYRNNKDVSFARVQKMLDGVSHVGWRESLRENGRWRNEECLASLQAVKAPIISINSDAQPTNVKAFKDINPGYKAHIMTDVGHLVFWDDPDKFNQLLEESIQDFLVSQ